MTCSVENCERTDVNKTWGLCRAHDQRRRRGVPLDSPIVNRREVSWPECSVEGCWNRSESKTGRWSRLCPTHAMQARDGKEPTFIRAKGRYKTCTVPGCENPFRSNRLCNKHNVRRLTYRLDEDRFIQIVTSPCEICGGAENLHIDHDHSCCPGEKSCGECVRGSLCSSCNLGLGAFRDNPAKLRSAVEYLRKNGIVE